MSTVLRELVERDWPQDYGGLVFLGRAAQEVGVSMFGPDWTGDEIHLSAHPLLKDGTSTLEAHQVHCLLHAYRPERGLPKPPSAPVSRALVPSPSLASLRFGAPALSEQQQSEPSYTPTHDDLEEARRVIAELNLGLAPALERKRATLREIARAAEAGELQLFHLDPSTNRDEQCPRSWWRGELLELRLSTWKVDPRAPHKTPDGHPASWIYVASESLAAFVRKKPFNKLQMGEIKKAQEAATLAAKLALDDDWNLTTALLWIGLRNFGSVARILARWPDHTEHGSGQAIG